MKFKIIFIYTLLYSCTLIAQEHNNYDSLFNQLIDSVIVLREKREFDLAIELMLKEKETQVFVNQEKYTVILLDYIVNTYRKNKNYAEAISAGKEFLQLGIVDSIRTTSVYRNLGYVYDNIGEESIALEYFLNSMMLDKASGNLKGLNNSLIALGSINHYLNNHKEALLFREEAVKVSHQNSDYNLIRSFRKLGYSYRQVKEFKLSRAYLDSALSLAFKKNKREISTTLNSIGYSNFIQGNYDSALIYYNKALENRLTNNQAYPFYIKANIAEVHHKLNDFSKAIDLSKNGINESYKTGNIEYIKYFSKILYDVYLDSKDYKNAVNYHVIYKAYYDSMVSEEKNAALLRNKIRFETEQVDAENSSLKQQKITSQQTIESQNRFMALLITGIVIFMIIAIFIYRSFILNKRLSEKVQIQSNKLQELDEAKSRFFANISHDLRTPLTLIMGSIEQVLADKEVFLTNKASKLLNTGYANGGRIIELTKEINELIQLEDGKLKLQQKPVNIVSYLDVLTGMFHSAAELKSIDFQFINNLNTTEAYLNLDTKQFEKVMYNLVSNAFKHTQTKGSIHIILTEKDEYYTVIIKDTGEGIPPKNVPYIFDRYYQTPDTTFKTHEGFGLGLALVKEIVTKHDGEVWVNSELGKGSEFGVKLKKLKKFNPSELENETIDMSFILDKQKTFSPLENHATKNRPNVNLDLNDNPEQSDLIILIVDDHPEVRAYIKAIIETRYKVIEAIDGKNALEILAKEKIGLIITDLMMPFFDGFELLEKLRDDEKLKTIPALVVSARTTDEDKERVLSSGINDFLSKPFNVNELLQRVENLLTLKEIWNSSNEDALFINKKETLKDAEKSLLKKVEFLINDRIDDPSLSVADLANQMAASERQVFRMIKKLTDMTPLEYIKEVRWQYVLYLMNNNKVTNNTEAAQAIGINNVSHFKTQYKKRFGKDPVIEI